MIQRVQSIYLFFAVLFILSITYFFPVVLNTDNTVVYTFNSIYSHATSLFSSLILSYSIFQFKNRQRQLLLNQIAKFSLSSTFFIIFFTKGEGIPKEGMFVFIIPYVLILLANRFIKKDEKLVQSADRLR